MAEQDSQPEISVVIATRFRETRLAFALEALATQTLPRERFEVIVVRADDATDGPLAEAPEGLDVRFMTGPAGPAIQRNVGWRAARGAWIAFTDDDCRPPPTWLERLCDARPASEAILQGRTEPDPDEKHLLWGLARSWEIIEPNDWYATCNIAYPRSALERAEGFDEGFPSAWGEDTDLGLRLQEEGVPHVYVDEALTWHAVLPRTLPGALRESRRLAATAVVVKRHPSHRDGLYGRMFLQPRHAWLLPFLGALPFLRRRPLLATLAMLPYLKRNFSWRNPKPRRLARQLVQLPVRITVDLTEVTVLARAGVANRVLVL